MARLRGARKEAAHQLTVSGHATEVALTVRFYYGINPAKGQPWASHGLNSIDES